MSKNVRTRQLGTAKDSNDLTCPLSTVYTFEISEDNNVDMLELNRFL